MRNSPVFFFLPVLFLLLASCRQEKKISQRPPAPATALTRGDSFILQTKKELDTLALQNKRAEWISRNFQAYAGFPENDVLKKRVFLDSIIAHRDFCLRQSSTDSLLQLAYFNLGNDLYLIDNEALTLHLEQFLHLHQQRPVLKSSFEIEAINMLGIAYIILLDYELALQYLEKEMMLSEQAEFSFYRPYASVNLGIALYNRGLPDSAIAVLKRSLAIRDLDAGLRCNMWMELSNALARKKDWKQSAAALEKAEAIALADKEVDDDTRASLQACRAGLQYNQGEFAAALRHYRQLTEQDSALAPRYRAKNRVALGRVYLALQEPDSALMAFHSSLKTLIPGLADSLAALPDEEQLYAENALMESLDALAAGMEKMAASQEAPRWLAHAADAWQAADRVQQKIMKYSLYNSSRLDFLKESRERSEKAIGVCEKLFMQSNNEAWALRALLFSENSKSALLLDHIRKEIFVDGSLKNDSLYHELGRTERSITGLARQIKSAEPEEQTRLAAEKKALEDALLKNSLAFNQKHPAFRSLAGEAPVFDVGAVRQKLLVPGQGLLEFFCADSAAWYVFLPQTGPASMGRLPPSCLNRVDSFLQLLSNRNADPATYEKLAVAPGAELLGPVLKDEKLKSVLLIPDAVLNFLPFEALVKKSGASGFRNMDFYLKHLDFHYGYSAATLMKQAEQPAGSASGMAAWAPVFQGGIRAQAPLPYTRKELNSISESAPGARLFFDSAASLASFRQQAGRFSRLHLASHAHPGSDSLPPQIEFFDSSLSLAEIYTLKLPAQLVVLSACETGLGKLDKNEGPLSLARGFYYAGARHVITSLWKVDDQATAQIMGSFYSRYKDGDPGTALQKSISAYLESAPAEKTAPYYWAGFIHIGFEGRRPASQPFLLLMAGLGIGFVLLVYYLRRKKKKGGDLP